MPTIIALPKLACPSQTPREARMNINPYPVNSCFFSTDKDNPSSFFGGEWEQITVEIQADIPIYAWRRIK